MDGERLLGDVPPAVGGPVGPTRVLALVVVSMPAQALEGDAAALPVEPLSRVGQARRHGERVGNRLRPRLGRVDRLAGREVGGVAPPAVLDVYLVRAVRPNGGGWVVEQPEHDVRVQTVQRPRHLELIAPEAETASCGHFGALPRAAAPGEREVEAALTVHADIAGVPVVRAGAAHAGGADFPLIAGEADDLDRHRGRGLGERRRAAAEGDGCD